ncbi:putative leucine-rich repeat-containing protein DDB_G0290503 isoform X1 [Argiope bruennichi]|uniref:putative leucine-rich repeat-containing protein DDB_G0290503 isoform X1 n=2 Tax=Argiope bruennichi TaxID=94029 RepID=UPI0024942501|nr:putative leucine-rich repeat-containing protein DDB_G0290503 isoform X1 [Argiope bruennichi]
MAECYDRSWRVGSKARGTRSQFRLNTGLLPFKCTYPAHLTDVMDAVPSTTSDFRRADFTSPVQGTRTRTVREYEQTIEELKKENFDLKLRLFLLEDNKNKNYLRNKGSNNEEQDNSVQVIVELKVETETLRNELACKCQQLQEALDEKEKYESELKELQSKFEEFQEQLTSLSPRPSEQELRLLKDENEILQKSNKDLTLILAEKDQNIELLNAQVDELSTKNKALKTKVEKSSLAIQGLVSKYYKDTEMIPKDLRPVVQSAVQAAKENRTEDLNAAVENIKASLSELMIANGGTSREARSNSVHGKDSMEELQKLAGISKSSEELAQVSQKSHQKSKHGHDGKDEQVSSESLQDSAKDKSESREDLEQMLDVVKENENLKLDNAEKAKIIDELNSACWEMEKKSIQLQSELLDAVSKVKDLDMKLKEEKSKHIGSLPMKHASVQTAVQWHLMQSKLSDKFAQNAGRSNNLEDLKEEILTLLLVIEQKDKEISDCEEKLSSLQQQLEIENKKEITFANLDKEFVKEKDELHQRLAHSCAVNNELMKHLRNLEIFMEDLLQHKNLDASSIENLSESSSFLSRLKIQREIEQSLELSTMLNDELSICESSKIFDPNDFTTSKDYSLSARYSYQPTDTSRFGLDLSNIPSNIQGRKSSQLSLQETSPNAVGTGKRKLSFSTLHKSSLDATLCDKENVVVLGTSNNEDLILLLNDKGDPEDVLIRNNHSHLERNQSTFGDGEHRRRCWESAAMNYLQAEKSVLDHHTEQWCSSKVDGSKVVSGWFNPYPSSDSDIWSEPDRDVSLQRIGIDLQKSPVSQKSPRRSRFRDKLSTDDISSQKNESSSSFSKLHTWSKRRKNSDTSRSSFICKKCMAHSQTSDAPSKDEKMDLQKVIDELSNKCHSQENHLENVINELNSKKNAIDALTKEKQELLNCINRLKETQKSLVESEASATERLARANSEYNKLQSLLKQFETRITHTDATCNQLKSELEKSKTQLKVLEQKCLEYVEELAMHSNAKTAFTEKLKSVEEEKAHLMDDVDALLMEKDELLSEIEVGKEYRRRLENENRSLSIKLNESSKEASLLRASSKNLEDAKNKLLKEKESCENSLMSSNSLCEELKNDLMKTQERLKKMEQKCAKYEEELNESLKSKQNITQSLSGIKSVMSSNFDALTSLCKQYLENNEAIETNKDILSNADKGDQIEMMLKEIISVNTKFQQIVKFLSEQLSSIHSAMEKSKVIENEDKSKINHLQGQLDDKEREIQSLKMLMVELQQKIEENKSINSEYQSQLEFAQKKLEDNEKLIKTLREEHKVKMQSLFEEFQQTLKNKEKFLEEFNHKAFASEKQLSSLQDEIHKYQNLINLKDDDITKLQERVFNLQTQINSILSKATSPAGQGSSKDNTRDFVSNSLKASASLSNENEANDEIMSTISNDASFNSIASEKEEEMGRKIDRYARKIKALQTKLLMTEKRIEILEKEKAELREELLAQVHGEKEKSKTSDEIETLVRELNELKSTLKTKTSFIKDLKSELFKTCNSLVDKQKEVDELQQKLSASSRNTEADLLSPVHIKLSPSYSDPIQKATEANIKELKKHKWELIQGILSHQKQLYERKNIHLGHFEKFKKHIEKLRSLQVSPSLFKSESEPLLNNSVATNSFYAEKCDRTLKNLQIELQLDVECLQNLKIFLKRFFMPLVLQNCICNNNNSKPDNDSNPSDKNTVNETKDSRRERLRLDLWKSSNVEVEHHPTTISTSDRLIATSSVVAHKLDLVEMALKEIKSALEHFKEMESPIGETPKKTAAKSLLLKILDELVNIDDNFTEVFHLKTVLKSLGLFDISIPPSPCKQESDRESLLSEETIALSRSGSLSPMSFDENFPYRLFTSSIKQKQESEHFRKSEGRPKQTLDISNRSQAAGGSQESLFLRSHFSSPDLGIESDPNHESSAPEQAEKEFKEVSGRMSKRQETMYSFTDSSSKIKDDSFGMGDTLHAIGYLEEYELLKKEVQESLVGIKTVLSRTSDGLHHLAKFTSPQKNLEYSTFKAIKDSCGNIEVCLRKAVKLVDNFWIAPCPSVKELNRLIQQNQELQDKLKLLQESKRRQEINFKEVMEKFKQAERLRENMEKKISKKLIKTKKVIRQAEIKILEKESQDLPSIPKYPCDDSAGQKS